MRHVSPYLQYPCTHPAHHDPTLLSLFLKMYQCCAGHFYCWQQYDRYFCFPHHMGSLISHASLSLHDIAVLHTVGITLHVFAHLDCDAFFLWLEFGRPQVCGEQSFDNSFLRCRFYC